MLMSHFSTIGTAWSEMKRSFTVPFTGASPYLVGSLIMHVCSWLLAVIT